MAVEPRATAPVGAGEDVLPGVEAFGVPATSLETALRAVRLAIAGVLLVALALNAALTWRSASVTERLERRELDLVRQARVLDGAVPAILADGRAFMLTQDRRFLDNLATDEAEAGPALDRLRDLAHTDEGRALVLEVEGQLETVVAGV